MVETIFGEIFCDVGEQCPNTVEFLLCALACLMAYLLAERGQISGYIRFLYGVFF